MCHPIGPILNQELSRQRCFFGGFFFFEFVERRTKTCVFPKFVLQPKLGLQSKLFYKEHYMYSEHEGKLEQILV